ncbi:unnamed protein product [Musa acuminata var. zebrina]
MTIGFLKALLRDFSYASRKFWHKYTGIQTISLAVGISFSGTVKEEVQGMQ